MTKLLSLRDGAAATLSEAEDAVTTLARPAVRPIYRDKNMRPEQIGTCTFVEVDGADYLVTAAHVIDNPDGHTLFVGQKGLVGLTMTFHSTVPPSGKRERDKVDFAFARVGTEWRERGIVPLPLSDLPDVEDAPFYSACGFPNSRNKRYNPVARHVRPTMRQYISSPNRDQATFADIGLDDSMHLAMNRPIKYGRSGGKRVRMFEPRGMSGGTIFGMYGLQRLDVMGGVGTPMILPEAIITEKNTTHQLLFGTRFVAIVDIIRRECGS